MSGSRLTLVLLLLQVCIIAAQPGVRPGFRARFTASALDYVKNVGIGELMKEISGDKLVIPPVSGAKGPAKYSVRNIRLQQFPRPGASMTPHQFGGLRWHTFNISPRVSADFSFTIDLGFFGDITKSGQLTATGRQLTFTLDFLIVRGPGGKPLVRVKDCVSRGGRLEVSFSGGWSTGLNMVAGMFKGAIKSAVMAQICLKARSEIELHTARMLNRIKVIERVVIGGVGGQVGEKFDVDFRLVRSPSFQENPAIIESFHKGAVYYHSRHADPPFQPAPIPPYAALTSRMAYVFVTDYLLNSAAYAAFQSGAMRFNVTSADLPPLSRGFLRTTCPMSLCLGTVFPELATAFAGSEARFNVYATSAPLITIQGDRIAFHALGQFDAYIRHRGRKQPLFSVTASVNASLSISVEGQRIRFTVISVRPNATLKSTTLQNIGTSFFFNAAVRVLSQQFVLPKLNEIGNRGFDIPEIKTVTLVNPQLLADQSTEHVFVIGTDIHVEPARP